LLIDVVAKRRFSTDLIRYSPGTCLANAWERIRRATCDHLLVCGGEPATTFIVHRGLSVAVVSCALTDLAVVLKRSSFHGLGDFNLSHGRAPSPISLSPHAGTHSRTSPPPSP